MNSKNHQIIIIIFAIFLSLLGMFINIKPTIAQSQNSNTNTTTNKKVRFNPPPVEDNGAPGGRQKGAGSHSLCKLSQGEEKNTPLIAVMPKIAIKNSPKNKVYVWSRTTSQHPTFWFYVAYPVNSYVEFTLQDEEENEIYQTTFPLDKSQGIIGLTLPYNQISLETGKSYHWYFNIMCDGESSTDDFVEGWVEKVELNPVIQSQLRSAKPLEKVSIYAENGLWNDTLDNLDRLRQKQPENDTIVGIWSDLLKQVGLKEIYHKPIIKVYNMAN